MADALTLKNKLLEEINETNKKSKTIEEITRNDDGLAVIFMGNNTPCVVEYNHWHDLNQYSWNCYFNPDGKIINYPADTVNSKLVKLHNYIYEKYVSAIPLGLTVDHRDPKKILDVRLSNLRLADKSLQMHNRNVPRNLNDEYTGVYFEQYGYNSRINGVSYGTYETAEEAAEKTNAVFKFKYCYNAKLNNIDYSKKNYKI